MERWTGVDLADAHGGTASLMRLAFRIYEQRKKHNDMGGPAPHFEWPITHFRAPQGAPTLCRQFVFRQLVASAPRCANILGFSPFVSVVRMKCSTVTNDNNNIKRQPNQSLSLGASCTVCGACGVVCGCPSTAALHAAVRPPRAPLRQGVQSAPLAFM